MFKSKFCKLVTLLITLTLISSLSTFGLAATASEQEISVVAAVQIALEKNLEVKIAGLNLENAKLDFQKSQANNLLTESKYLQLQSELNLAQAQDAYLQTRNTVLINTVKDYYQLLLLQIEQGIKAKQVTLEQSLLAETRSQVTSGHLGHLELLKQDSRYQNALFNLDKAKADQQQLVRKIKANLGLNATEAEDVQFTAISLQPLVLSEEEACQQALDHSFTLASKKGRLDLAQVDVERATAKATPELELAKTRNNLEIAKLEYQKTQEEILQSVQNQYFLFQQAKKRLELSEQTYQQSLENYQIVQKQKEAGLKTANDLLTAELNLLQEDSSRLTAEMNYLINQLQLQKLMGIEIEVVIGETCK